MTRSHIRQYQSPCFNFPFQSGRWQLRLLTLLVSLLVFLAGCEDTGPENGDASPALPFEQIEHYSIRLSEQEKDNIRPTPPLIHTSSPVPYEDSLKKSVISGTVRMLDQQEIVQQLETIGFHKKDLIPEKNRSIYQLFTRDTLGDRPMLKCLHLYQDILVLKHNSNSVAAIQICFSCRAIIIESGDLNLNPGINDADYQKLYNLLYLR